MLRRITCREFNQVLRAFTKVRKVPPRIGYPSEFKAKARVSFLSRLHLLLPLPTPCAYLPSTRYTHISYSRPDLSVTMKTAVAALAMCGTTSAFVTPNAVRALAPSTRASSSLSMEFAGGLRGADGPEPNSKNFDPFGFSEARPENLLFFREAEIKVRRKLYA